MVRRVVSGSDGSGRPAVLFDGESPRTSLHEHTPGFVNTLLWHTSSTCGIDTRDDRAEAATSYVPGPGETVALMVTFPPDTVFADPGFDSAAAAAERHVTSPGLAELFEPDAPGMHTTPTIDYGVVVTGSIELDLDDGSSTRLDAGDVIVQGGVRHAWRNTTDQPATVFFVLIGAS